MGTQPEPVARPSLGIGLLLESDGPGGAEVVVLTLATGLVAAGCRVLVVVPEGGVGWLGSRCAERGIPTATFRFRSAVDPGCLHGLIGLIRGHRLDLVHSHEFTLSVYGAAAAAATGRPHLTTIHGRGVFMERLRNRIALRWAFRRSAARVAVSRATAEWLAAGLGIPSARLEVVTNGVEEPRSSGVDPRAAFGVSAGDVLLLAVGNLYPVKGHRFLLEALGRLRRSRPDLSWALVVAGEGAERAALASQAAAEGIADRVQLLGHRLDVPDLLAAADLFVLPSLSEGTPMSLLEAMLAGKAVVVSAVGGIPDVLGPDASGIQVPPADVVALTEALERTIADPELRGRLGREAQRRGREHYRAEIMVKRYLSLYRSVLASG
jgi:glycosyltransferase involved in cell wall biosynthesis